MIRTFIGVAVGIAVGGAVTYILQDSTTGVFAGSMVGITIRFWVGAPGGRRG
ncbi:hypothetical protein AB0E08_07675 [Streptomyces sp. NPDC048281]|uniref:hypothetical protein n=1 Tax=Streptomyces sp. NPDC048281 TaxID=3154715 RepID=UPI0034459E2F